MLNVNKRVKLLAAGIILLLLGLVSGSYYEKHRILSSGYNPYPITERQNGYKYISPLLAFDFPENKQFQEYTPLNDKIQSYIEQEKAQGKVTQISFYYRNPTNGAWVGVNESELYTPASLFKVPMLIAYLKYAETNPLVLQQKITVPNGDQNANETIKPSQFAMPGQQYTVDQLLNYMIVDSDNNATAALFYAADRNSFAEVFSDLNISLPQDLNNSGNLISVKDYAFFFRVLYSSTYLNRDMSEKALGLLAQSKYALGIRAGVPSNTTVASKFGEYALQVNGQITERQLHECGIVYGPQTYLMCVMTKGNDLGNLEDAVKTISAMVYQEVSK